VPTLAGKVLPGDDFIGDEVNMAHECNGKGGEVVHKVAMLAGKTVAGLGLGVSLGVGALLIAAVAEVAIPAIVTFKALGLTGGALGFLYGAKDLK